MQSSQHTPGPSYFEQFGSTIAWTLFIASALAVSVEVFLHKGSTIGGRYLRLQALAAGLLLFFWPSFWEGHDPRPMLVFLAAYALLCAGTTLSAWHRSWRGQLMEHSRYTGRSRLAWLAKGLPERHLKAHLEPLVVAGLGWLAIDYNRPLGVYLVLAGIGLAMSVSSSVRTSRSRLLDLHDAQIDQRQTTEHWRSGRYY